MNKLALLGVLLTLVVACGQKADEQPPLYTKPAAKTLFTNAKIYDYSQGRKVVAEAMLVDQGRIVALGSEEELQANAGTDSRRVDLQGRYILPGIVDSHAHPGLITGLADGEVSEDSTIPAASREETLAWLRQYAKRNPLKPFIMIGEWDVEAFLPKGPTRQELDEIFSFRPAILMDNSGHSFWLNSAALNVFGIDKDTPDVAKNISYFVRDANGEPTGWAKEFAMMPYITDYLVPDEDELKETMAKHVQMLSAMGVTTLLDAGNFAWEETIYKVVSQLDKEGRLPLRYQGTHHIWRPEQLQNAVAEVQRLQALYGSDNLSINTIKIHYDGVAEIATAAMLQPYVTDPSNRGGVLFTAKQLSGLLRQANKAGIHLHLHTVGDWATREALDAVEILRAEQGSLNIQVSLAHLETVAAMDIPRFKQLGVHANFTPHWFSGDHFGGAGSVNLGRERAAAQQLAGEFARQGASITLSSDTTSMYEIERTNPFMGLEMSISRQEPDPIQSKSQDVRQGLNLLQALQAYTYNGAKQLGLHAQTGALKPGLSADFIVLNRSPFGMAVKDLHSIKPVAVYYKGHKR